MKEPHDWDESDVLTLISERVQESLTLDYKQSEALARDDKRKAEMSKDVSAFANSAGGIIIYGVAEDKYVPLAIDGGCDPSEITKEWIDQVLSSTIQPKIENLRIVQIPLKSKNNGRVIYVISIPQASTRAPHQAKDKRYYRRFEYQSVPMEDYEVRDILRRATTPDLSVKFSFEGGGKGVIKYGDHQEISNPIKIFCNLANSSGAPASYCMVRIYLDEAFTFQNHNLLVSQGYRYKADKVVMAGGDRHRLQGYSLNWTADRGGGMPIFEGVPLPVSEDPISVTLHSDHLNMPVFYLGYEIVAPGFASDFKLARILHRPATELNILDN